MACAQTSRAEMRTVLGVRELAIADGTQRTFEVKVNQVFRIENWKVTSQGGPDFLIRQVMLGNTPALPASTNGIRASLMSEVSTDMCLRWPDIRPDLPATITIENDSGAEADFESMFIGWMLDG